MSLERHFIKCKARQISIELDKKNEIIQTLNETIEKQGNKISELEGRLERIAIKGVEKSTTTTNTQNINLLPLTEEHMKRCAHNLTLDHIKDGPLGYARYALEHMFKNRLNCTDKSRNKVAYAIDGGYEVIDCGMSKLAPKFFKCIEPHNDYLIDDCVEEFKQNIEKCLSIEPKTKWEEEDRDDKLEKMNEMINMLCYLYTPHV
jgi:hypothetical protein